MVGRLGAGKGRTDRPAATVTVVHLFVYRPGIASTNDIRRTRIAGKVRDHQVTNQSGHYIASRGTLSGILSITRP